MTDNHTEHTEHEDHTEIRGMVIIVRKQSEDFYLCHLPMFDVKHGFQVILEASLKQLYSFEPLKLTHKALYTLEPKEKFPLSDLFQPDSQSPRRDMFDVKIFWGHFERGGEEILIPSRKFYGFDCWVRRVIYVHKFDPAAQELPQLEYLLFGDREEQFLAHLITKPPDFDQILAVKVIDPALTDEEIRSGITVVFPGRPNTIESRLGEYQRLVGQRRANVENPQSTVELQIETYDELYYETDDLAENHGNSHIL